MANQIVSKISPASIMGEQQKDLVTCKTWLYRVAGRVTGYEKVSTTFGESICLKGAFNAVRFDDQDNSFESGECYLPCGVDEMIASQSPTVDKPVDFLYDIGKHPNKREPLVKYDWCIADPKPDNAGVRAAKALLAVAPPTTTTIKSLPGSTNAAG